MRDKLRELQALLGHRVPDGDLATIVDLAVTLLLERVRKERFAVGCKPRAAVPAPASADGPAGRHVPAAIRRAVYERDGGQCTFVDDRGRRCAERGLVEFDHADGFARRPEHTVNGIRLRCRSHNDHAAERLYGAAFMADRRARNASGAVRGP